MSKLQAFKRIITEDFDQKDRALITKLAYAINVFAEDVVNAFSNKITIEDNLNIVTKDLIVKVDSTGAVTSGGTLKTGLDHTCAGIIVVKATNTTTSANIPSGTPFLTFSETSGLLTISNISNLTSNNKYALKLLLL